jgi:hypothetical protein
MGKVGLFVSVAYEYKFISQALYLFMFDEI